MEFVLSHFVLPFSQYGIAICFFMFITWFSYQETHVFKTSVLKGLLVSYLFLIYCVTILSRTPLPDHVMYLNPFRNYVFIKAKDLGVISEALMNIAIELPIGLLLPVFLKQHKFSLTLLCGFLISLSVESIQWFTKTGWFETQDLMNNTLGVVFGYVVYRWIARGK